jgi:hypothetical protein
MYRKMPFGQLAKCAEALAFRKAFPADLSGPYTAEDLEAPGQSDNSKPSPPAATLAQRKAMEELRRSLGLDPAEMTSLVKGFGFNSSAEMTAAAAGELIAHFDAQLAEKRHAAAGSRQREPGEEG